MSSVNSQITDAVTMGNVKTIGESSSFAMASIYQSHAHSMGILFENAVAAQQRQNMLALAASNQGVMQIYGAGTAATAGSSQKTAQVGIGDNLVTLLALAIILNNQ
jgi:Killing trait